MATFLDKIETTFDDLKAWMINEFGDHTSIHNATSTAKMEVISHAADHFGEVSSEVGKDAPVTDASASSTSSTGGQPTSE